MWSNSAEVASWPGIPSRAKAPHRDQLVSTDAGDAEGKKAADQQQRVDNEDGEKIDDGVHGLGRQKKPQGVEKGWRQPIEERREESPRRMEAIPHGGEKSLQLGLGDGQPTERAATEQKRQGAHGRAAHPKDQNQAPKFGTASPHSREQ